MAIFFIKKLHDSYFLHIDTQQKQRVFPKIYALYTVQCTSNSVHLSHLKRRKLQFLNSFVFQDLIAPNKFAFLKDEAESASETED